MASDAADDLEARQMESYSDTGNEKSIEVTLSGTPGTLTTITVPAWAKGFKLYPRSNAVRFAVGKSTRTAAAVGASSGASLTESDMGVGGICKADMWETRLLPSNTTGRVMTLRSTTASVVIDVEFF